MRGLRLKKGRWSWTGLRQLYRSLSNFVEIQCQAESVATLDLEVDVLYEPGTRKGAFGVGKHDSQLDSGSLKRGGPTVRMNLRRKAKFKPPWSNKGVQGTHPHQPLSTRGWTSHHGAGPSPGAPRPQSLWGKYTAPWVLMYLVAKRCTERAKV